MKIFIESNTLFSSILKYTIRLVLSNKKIIPVFCKKPEAQIIIDTSPDSDLNISLHFYQLLSKRKFQHSYHLNEDYFIRDQEGKKDKLATIFYLSNCIQEYDFPNNELDHFGRFPYKKSLQYKFGIIKRNVVQEIIDDIFSSVDSLKNIKLEKESSQVFLSHDVDYIYDPIKREIKHAIKKLKIVPALVFSMAYFNRKSMHLDIEEIYKVHKEYNRQSHFFWISNSENNIPNIKNGDYKIRDPFVLDKFNRTKDGVNGLHKSTNQTTLNEEMALLPKTSNHNRYHYLKYTLPQAWDSIAESNCDYDHSLAFGSQMGFRNSYGKSFTPFNLKSSEAYQFTVIPFQIMDSTLMYYSSLSIEEYWEEIKEFIISNQFDCDLSIVWHNTSFSSFSFNPLKILYRKILNLLADLKIQDFDFSAKEKLGNNL